MYRLASQLNPVKLRLELFQAGVFHRNTINSVAHPFTVRSVSKGNAASVAHDPATLVAQLRSLVAQ